MRKLQIAATPSTIQAFQTERQVVSLKDADLTTISAVVMTTQEASSGLLEKVDAHAFGIPVILLNFDDTLPSDLYGQAVSVINANTTDIKLFGRQIDAAAQKYENQLLPPFLVRLKTTSKKALHSLTVRGIKAAPFSVAIPLVVNSHTSLVKTSSELTSVMRTSRWVTC